MANKAAGVFAKYLPYKTRLSRSRLIKLAAPEYSVHKNIFKIILNLVV
jgi:hypothetical protein